jgi:hypothetical protein
MGALLSSSECCCGGGKASETSCWRVLFVCVAVSDEPEGDSGLGMVDMLRVFCGCRRESGSCLLELFLGRVEYAKTWVYAERTRSLNRDVVCGCRVKM